MEEAFPDPKTVMKSDFYFFLFREKNGVSKNWKKALFI